MHIITQATLMPTAHWGPVPGAGTISFCPHQGHTWLGSRVYSLEEGGGEKCLVSLGSSRCGEQKKQAPILSRFLPSKGMAQIGPIRNGWGFP